MKSCQDEAVALMIYPYQIIYPPRHHAPLHQPASYGLNVAVPTNSGREAAPKPLAGLLFFAAPPDPRTASRRLRADDNDC
jgi:hypothetical protein